MAFHHFLLPVDGWVLAPDSLEKVIIFARETKARITVLHLLRDQDNFTEPPEWQVDGPKRLAENRPQHAPACLKVIATKAMLAGVQCETTYVVNPRPHAVIHNTAEERNCDLILVVPYGQGGIRRFLDGCEEGGMAMAMAMAMHKIPFVVV